MIVDIEACVVCRGRQGATPGFCVSVLCFLFVVAFHVLVFIHLRSGACRAAVGRVGGAVQCGWLVAPACRTSRYSRRGWAPGPSARPGGVHARSATWLETVALR